MKLGSAVRVKVLLLNTDRFVDAKAGTERVLCNMANTLVERGYDVKILCADNKEGDAPYSLHDSVSVENCGAEEKKLTFFQKIKRELIFNRKKRRQYVSGIVDNKIATRIKPAIDEYVPDIIICYQMDGVRIVEHNISPKCPVIAMFHFDPEELLERTPDNTLVALEKCEKVQVLLKSFIPKTKKYINTQNVVCIPNAVPQFDFREKKTDLNIIINVGRFSKRQKRQHLLIEAFHKVADQNHGWTLELWGEPDGKKRYYHYCKNLVKKYCLEDRVKFCGTTDAIFTEMQRASIFAFPSAYEGFGLALAEAMSLGLPAIGCKTCPAVNELIKDGQSGILCDDNEDGLANALSELMQDKDKRRRYGTQAKEDMKMYAPEKIWDMWEDLIQETVREYKKM